MSVFILKRRSFWLQVVNYGLLVVLSAPPLVLMGFFWKPGRDMGGWGIAILSSISVVSTFVLIMATGAVNSRAQVHIAQLKGEAKASKAEKDVLSFGDFWRIVVDPLAGGGIGYTASIILGSYLGWHFGAILASQVVLSQPTALVRNQLQFQGEALPDQPVLRRRDYLKAGICLLVVICAIPVFLWGVTSPTKNVISYLNIDLRQLATFGGIVAPSAAFQFLFVRIWHARKNKTKIHRRLWICWWAKMLPILVGIEISASVGITASQWIGTGVQALHPGETGLSFLVARDYLRALGQEAIQCIIGGIGVQMLMSGYGTHLPRVLWLLLVDGAILLKNLLLSPIRLAQRLLK